MQLKLNNTSIHQQTFYEKTISQEYSTSQLTLKQTNLHALSCI